MRIVHLRDSPFVGGPEKQILGQCLRLDRSLYEPLVVSFASSDGNSLTKTAADLGIASGALKDGKMAFPRAVDELRAILADSGDCVVVSSGFKADFTAWLACRREGVSWVAWFHGYTGATARVRAYEAIDMAAIRRADAVVAVCEASATHLRGLGLRRVFVAPNAVDADRIASRGDRASARRDLGVDDNDLLVGTAARFSKEKGLNHLVDAIPHVLQRHPGARFVLIGEGPMGGALKKRCAEQAVSDRVLFTGFREDAVSLLKAFDVFVLPSLKENLPIALLEAMACGVSVVATDVGGVREVLEPVGVVPVVSGSPQAIAHSVCELLADPRLRADHALRLSARARQFSFDHQLDAVLSVIRAIGGRRR